jgi:acyl carrier protein
MTQRPANYECRTSRSFRGPFIQLVIICMASVLVPSGCKKESPKHDDRSSASQPAARPIARSSKRIAPIPEEQVESTVIDIVASQAGRRPGEIKPNLNLRKDLKFDDLDEVETVMELEDTFSMSIPDEVATKFQTVRDLIDYARLHRKR